MRTWMASALIAAVAMMAAGCSDSSAGKGTGMRYEVTRVSEPIRINADWDKPVWKGIQPVEVKEYMGDKPEHFPRVQAKLAYDATNVYLIFRVEDQYVRAVARKHQDMVCRDSCAEFFFAPGTDVTKGYFNLEGNCGGTILLHFQTIPRKNMVPLKPEELDRIEIAHSLPKIIDPEITAPTTWTTEYRIPMDIMDAYLPQAAKPAPGVTWRANFFKCGDQTSHPHWLTWAKVDRPKPDFHVPEFFGTLVFGK